MKNMTKADFNTCQLLGKNSKIYCTNEEVILYEPQI